MKAVKVPDCKPDLSGAKVNAGQMLSKKLYKQFTLEDYKNECAGNLFTNGVGNPAWARVNEATYELEVNAPAPVGTTATITEDDGTTPATTVVDVVGKTFDFWINYIKASNSLPIKVEKPTFKDKNLMTVEKCKTQLQQDRRTCYSLLDGLVTEVVGAEAGIKKNTYQMSSCFYNAVLRFDKCIRNVPEKEATKLEAGN